MSDIQTCYTELRFDQALATQIADFLLSLIPAGWPRRVARMSYTGEQKPEKDRQKKQTGRLVPRGKYEEFFGQLSPGFVPVRGYSSTPSQCSLCIRAYPSIFAVVHVIGDTLAIRFGGAR